jgi:TolB protein
MKRTSCLLLVILLLTLFEVSPAGHKRVAAAAANRGTIAYVRGGAEIRLVEPDGTGDRRIWTLPRPELAATQGVTGVAWRPDGEEIAFSSGHEAVQSLYQSDLYAIRPDGTGLRKITNPPDADEFARFPKGSVSVTVRNSGGPLAAPSSFFIVYVAGAPEPQSVALPPGSSRTLTFQNVADFGNHPQPVVAMFGKSRWFIPGVDVQAGHTVQAGVLNIMGSGLQGYGAYGVAWRNDGSQIAYGLGNCAGLFRVPANPTAGSHQDQPMLAGRNSANVCTWDWGPTAETANKVLIGGGMLDANIYLATEGGDTRGEKLVGGGPTDLMLEVEWLPDASGFLFSLSTGAAANLYRYDFATKEAKQLTRFDGEFLRSFAVSPDGQSVVFERAKQFNDQHPDLWVMRLDGGDMRLLVRDGSSPSWGR